MRQGDLEHGGPLEPIAAIYRSCSHKANATNEQLGWLGLKAAHHHASPGSECITPPLTHHRFVLFVRPPETLDLLYEGVKRYVPPPAGAIAVLPAGHSAEWRWRGHCDSLHVYLEPGLVTRVAAETFDLDPARLTVPPLDALDLPHLRAVMREVDAELMADAAGGPLVAESLSNLLAVHLIRQLLAPRRPSREPNSAMPQRRLRAVIEYIEEHLDASTTLEQMAAVAHLSPYHFARQFKLATGLPPHQFIIARRVERAKQFLQEGDELSLSRVAIRAGFVDQSQLSRHFKRIVGVTPGKFRTAARTN